MTDPSSRHYITIVDLAVRGYIKIEEKVDTFLVFHHKDYVFHLLKARGLGARARSRTNV